MKNNTLKSSLFAAILVGISVNSEAQKLPSEQKEPMYAPANTKIDGKPTEWVGKFQAYNSATLLTYVMANDEENLYLTIQADPTHGMGKIFYGGISLVVKSRKDKKLTPVKMTYPLVSLAQRTEIVIPLRTKTNNADSAAIVANEWLGKSAKIIAVSGIQGITDPDVSVYNDMGLKAAALADNTRTITFEYLLPIKYIKHLLDENSSFDYNIIVNGDKLAPGTVVVGGSPIGGGGGGGGLMSISVSPVGDIFSPTDLKATYTLAKSK